MEDIWEVHFFYPDENSYTIREVSATDQRTAIAKARTSILQFYPKPKPEIIFTSVFKLTRPSHDQIELALDRWYTKDKDSFLAFWELEIEAEEMLERLQVSNPDLYKRIFWS